MRLHRFYVNKPLGEEIVVENEDGRKLIHQWTNVFRYESGDEVFLFSDQNPGTDYLYRLTSVSKEVITLVPISQQKNIVPSPDVVLVMALVKKDTFEILLEGLTPAQEGAAVLRSVLRHATTWPVMAALSFIVVLLLVFGIRKRRNFYMR